MNGCVREKAAMGLQCRWQQRVFNFQQRLRPGRWFPEDQRRPRMDRLDTMIAYVEHPLTRVV